jgi:hypothetical protein
MSAIIPGGPAFCPDCARICLRRGAGRTMRMSSHILGDISATPLAAPVHVRPIQVPGAGHSEHGPNATAGEERLVYSEACPKRSSHSSPRFPPCAFLAYRASGRPTLWPRGRMAPKAQKHEST